VELDGAYIIYKIISYAEIKIQ